MKFNNKALTLLFGASLLFASCNKDVLDRGPLTSYFDDEYWQDETQLRLFAKGFYTQYFNGYNSSWTTDYTPVRGYTFSDDLTINAAQSSFENTVPSSRYSTSESGSWIAQYGGPTWNFSWVRKSNIFIDRVENISKSKVTTEAYKHWSAVARFFRGFEYARLVSVFGDVPYFDGVVAENDFDTQYKDRDDRGLVMDKVYDDFKYTLANIRTNDGLQNLDKYVAAAFISRLMLFEGSWQKYHGLDQDRAKKYLEFAVEAAEIVMNSGKYSFDSDYKSLFASQDLAANKEVILYRAYDNTLGVTHAIASYQNGLEAQNQAVNLDFLKSYICNDGEVYSNSSVDGANSFRLEDLAKSRDPRFEASFSTDYETIASSLVYGNKFVARDGYKLSTSHPDYSKWASNTNTSDAPVIRLAEVVLNWIEAKQILAESFGGAPVTQQDLDKSINAIRNRPLDPIAIQKGVKKTAPLILNQYPNDPNRDADVSPLMWEIRRERRMEFVFEFSRLQDIRRWKKLEYMDFSRKQDYFLGAWVNVPQDAKGLLADKYKGVTKVLNAAGNVVTYDGTNADQLVGFLFIQNAKNRNQFSERNYLAPVGLAQINEYEQRGYKLTQTKYWN